VALVQVGGIQEPEPGRGDTTITATTITTTALLVDSRIVVHTRPSNRPRSASGCRQSGAGFKSPSQVFSEIEDVTGWATHSGFLE
jgi:hypothetical protein